MNNLTENKIHEIDKSNMFQVLLDFPKQVIEALEIGEKAPAMSQTTDFLILGMGGSAIGGDLLSTFFANTPGLKHIRININRDYEIPGYINSNTAVIASSYSGGTEETITALKYAAEKTGNILCITSGGTLEATADANGYKKAIIPGGLMPRCALGYSFFTLLKILLKSVAIDNQTKENINKGIKETLELLSKKSKLYSLANDENPAYKIAETLKNTIPVVYSSNKLNTVNMRWRAQFQENAKNLSFGNVLPEMNHNEINSWTNPKHLTKEFSVLMLKHSGENKKTALRMKAVEKLLKQEAKNVLTVETNAEDYLAAMFDLIYVADWTSYFLAILNNEDPTPIPLITKLKELLS